MANHKQALKRNRQRIKTTARNRHVRSTMRSCVKSVRAAIDAADATKAKDALKLAVKQMDKAVTKGVVRRKTASRSISRLTLAVNRLQSGK